MTEPGLRTLFNLDDAAAFVNGAWPNELFVAGGPVERLAGLVDYDLRQLIEMKKAHTKAFFRTLEGRPASVTVTPGQERDLYEAGFTLYFHGLRAPKIDEWVAALDAELGLLRGVTRVSGFASRRGLGLLPHYDMNDNFVCQARGTKRWRIWPNTHVVDPTVGYTLGSRPTAAQAAEAPHGFPSERDLGPPARVVEMQAGTVMFCPRGVWHDTETVDALSMHVNVQSGLATWKDLIEYLMVGTTALHMRELRSAVRDLFDGDALSKDAAAELKEKLTSLASAIGEGDLKISKPAFHKWVAKKRRAI